MTTDCILRRMGGRFGGERVSDEDTEYSVGPWLLVIEPDDRSSVGWLVGAVTSSKLTVPDEVQSSEPPIDCGVSNKRSDAEEARSGVAIFNWVLFGFNPVFSFSDGG